jgi:hypothetical protein
MGNYEKEWSLAIYTEINPALIKQNDRVHNNKQLKFVKITFTSSITQEICLQNPWKFPMQSQHRVNTTVICTGTSEQGIQ